LVGLHFGTGGNPISTIGNGSISGVKRIRELGLDCMEIEWVQGNPPIKDTKPLDVTRIEATKQPKIFLSCHSSYYINLAGEPQTIEASRDRIQKSVKALATAGGRNVVFHPAFYKGHTVEETFEIVKTNMENILTWMDEHKIENVTLRPETTGKGTQFGSLDEIIRLSKELPNTLPCVDFAHLHARSGGMFNTYDEFCKILDKLSKELGDNGISNMHIHISGIQYSDKGEIRHLKLEESDMNYKDWLKAMKKFGAAGTIICESPILEDDALIMKEYYGSLS